METNLDSMMSDTPGPSGDSGTTGSKIKAMDKTSVHRLCSGQVVLSMAIAVKELVENALDAGSNNVEVRLEDHGAKTIEVSDNGKGITQENFEALTLKHHTSKISEFEDVAFVSTFGFRGEALSSLCAVSRMSVTTCHSNSETGTRLEYDHNGAITSRQTYPRPVGTSVKISDLFCTMPVRLKEFQRNLKKEYNKMLHNLHAYCLISTHARITCVNTTEKGKRNTIISTRGHGSIASNICEIFGATQNSSLQKIEWHNRDPHEDILTDFNLSHTKLLSQIKMYTLDGYISTCEHSKGRSSPDRQFFYINDRPCDIAKVSKLVNEVYHQFNRHQYPFVLLNIKSKNLDNVDVNVTPDKRLVFVENEKLLLATVKSCLVEMFSSTPSILRVSNSFAIKELPNESEEKCLPNKEKNNFNLSKLRAMYGGDFSDIAQMKVDTSVIRRKKNAKDNSTTDQKSILELWSVQHPSPIRSSIHDDMKIAMPSKEKTTSESSFKATTTTELSNSEECTMEHSTSNDKNSENSAMSPNMVAIPNKKIRLCVGDEEEKHSATKKERKEVILNVSTKFLKEYAAKKPNNHDKLSECLVSRRFCASIDPKENNNAEEELRKEINKKDFLKMKIYGQFNRGFIIAGLGEDLFIIDQHASDEKVALCIPEK